MNDTLSIFRKRDYLLDRFPFLKIPLTLWFTVIFFCAGTAIVHAQESSLIRVLAISDEDGNPMAGANVLLFEPGTEPDGMPISFCVTDRDGLCEIRNVEPGRKFELRITFVGFAPHRQQIITEPGERKVIRATLSTDVEQFDELTVERPRYITTGEVGVRRITSTDISRIPTPSVGGDLVSYLQTVPGIITSGDRGGDLFIRGGTPDQNLILVDNLPIIKPFHISNLFSAFPDEIVQSVDMYAGGFGAEFTGATSAVIDVSLRPGNMREFRSSAAASPYLFSLHAEGPFETDRQSFLLMGRKSTIEQFGPAITGEDVPINFSDMMARYSILGDNISCNITAMRTFDQGEIVPYRNILHTWTNTVIGGRCLGFDERFNHPLEVTAGYTRYRNSEGTNGSNERFSAISQIYFDVALRYDIFNHPVNVGFGTNFRSYNTELQEQFMNLESFSRVIPIAHLYASSEFEIGSRLTLQPGVASQLTLDTPFTFEPRFRTSYQPDGTDRQQISLAAGKYVQLISGISDERDIGTVFTALQPIETDDPLPSALHGIIAYQQRIGARFTANMEGFVKQHRYIPVSKWTPEARLEIETAMADGFTHGFDVRMQYNHSRWFASIGYGFSKVEYEAVTGDLGAWIEEPVFEYNPAHDQRHKLNTILSYSFAGFTANTRWEFGTGMPYTRIFGFDMSIRIPDEEPQTDPGTARILFTRPYSERLPTYHRLDVSIDRTFRLAQRQTLEAEIGVINTYNRNNIFSFDFRSLQRVDQAPIFPYLSVKFNLM